MSFRTRTSSVLLATSIAAALALTGCSAGTPSASTPTPKPTVASGQTKAQGCNELRKTVEPVATSMQSAYSKLVSDPKAAVAKLDELSSAMRSGLAKVTNADVHTVGQKAADSLDSMVTEVHKAVDNPKSADPAKIKAAGSAMQTDFTAIGTVCK